MNKITLLAVSVFSLCLGTQAFAANDPEAKTELNSNQQPKAQTQPVQPDLKKDNEPIPFLKDGDTVTQWTSMRLEVAEAAVESSGLHYTITSCDMNEGLYLGISSQASGAQNVKLALECSLNDTVYRLWVQKTFYEKVKEPLPSHVTATINGTGPILKVTVGPLALKRVVVGDEMYDIPEKIAAQKKIEITLDKQGKPTGLTKKPQQPDVLVQ